ncbi:MAG: hypothetical protein Q3X08_00570, partial [Bifidobacterium sp.]|uniref:hypothetical protein n=1 Tax=Bifidobacterium sp. TaxID=41200 RepID=UPI00284252B9
MVRKAFFSFLPAARFAKQEMKDILQAGCALRNHINAYEKQESSKKGKRGFPLGAVKFYFTSRRPTAALFLPSLAYRLAQEEPMNSP